MGGGEKRVPVSLVQLIRNPLWCRNGSFLPKQNCLSHEKQKKGTQTEAEEKGEGGSVVSVGRLWNAGLSPSSVFFPLTISSLELQLTTRKTCSLTCPFTLLPVWNSSADCPGMSAFPWLICTQTNILFQWEKWPQNLCSIYTKLNHELALKNKTLITRPKYFWCAHCIILIRIMQCLRI